MVVGKYVGILLYCLAVNLEEVCIFRERYHKTVWRYALVFPPPEVGGGDGCLGMVECSKVYVKVADVVVVLC